MPTASRINKITVLTGPVGITGDIFAKIILKTKDVLRFLLNPSRHRSGGARKIMPKYGGHSGVTRSLVEGFRRINADFNYQPKKIGDIGETVIVLSGIAALKQAIALKKRGRVKKLLAGPNLMVSPAEFKGILSSPEIDICIVPSEWVKNFYSIVAPDLRERIKVWPAGVDADFFRPADAGKKPKSILFYNKRPEPGTFSECRKICEKYGYSVEILDYGQHKIGDYRDALRRNSFLAHFVEQESQGLSLLESWAMDVPTLVWNPGFWHYQMENFPCSSAPYLSKDTGVFFRDSAEFEKLFAENSLDLSLFRPRRWVLENLTDEKSAGRLLNICLGQDGEI